MTMICNMGTTGGSGQVKGNCANCAAEVFESLCILDDAYNVWMGRCPVCKALNYLSMSHGLRGYSSAGMHLVLPTDEEREANNLPADTITSGSCGRPADQHGTPAGEASASIEQGDQAMSGNLPPGVTDNDPHFDSGPCEHKELHGGYCEDCGELIDEDAAAEAAWERRMEDGETFRGNEAAAYQAEEQERARRLK